MKEAENVNLINNPNLSYKFSGRPTWQSCGKHNKCANFKSFNSGRDGNGPLIHANHSPDLSKSCNRCYKQLGSKENNLRSRKTSCKNGLDEVSNPARFGSRNITPGRPNSAPPGNAAINPQWYDWRDHMDGFFNETFDTDGQSDDLSESSLGFLHSSIYNPNCGEERDRSCSEFPWDLGKIFETVRQTVSNFTSKNEQQKNPIQNSITSKGTPTKEKDKAEESAPVNESDDANSEVDDADASDNVLQSIQPKTTNKIEEDAIDTKDLELATLDLSLDIVAIECLKSPNFNHDLTIEIMKLVAKNDENLSNVEFVVDGHKKDSRTITSIPNSVGRAGVGDIYSNDRNPLNSKNDTYISIDGVRISVVNSMAGHNEIHVFAPHIVDNETANAAIEKFVNLVGNKQDATGKEARRFFSITGEDITIIGLPKKDVFTSGIKVSNQSANTGNKPTTLTFPAQNPEKRDPLTAIKGNILSSTSTYKQSHINESTPNQPTTFNLSPNTMQVFCTKCNNLYGWHRKSFETIIKKIIEKHDTNTTSTRKLANPSNSVAQISSKSSSLCDDDDDSDYDYSDVLSDTKEKIENAIAILDALLQSRNDYEEIEHVIYRLKGKIDSDLNSEDVSNGVKLDSSDDNTASSSDTGSGSSGVGKFDGSLSYEEYEFEMGTEQYGDDLDGILTELENVIEKKELWPFRTCLAEFACLSAIKDEIGNAAKKKQQSLSDE
jgi:hypothetical protein